MGYYVRGYVGVGETKPSSPVMSSTKAEQALDFFKRESLSDYKERPDAWLGQHRASDFETMETIYEVLEGFGYTCDVDGQGNLTDLYYLESKAGDEDWILEELYLFFEPGWYFYWQGEEGEHWRTNLRDNRHEDGRIVYG